MLVVKLELWPFGDESSAKELGRLLIANDGSGTQEVGNYEAALTSDYPDYVEVCRIRGFNRFRGAWALVREVLNFPKVKADRSRSYSEVLDKLLASLSKAEK